MNYRHIYHAGNFADVLKHVVLTRLIRYMQKKDGGFRVLDTHAGIGLYDLSSEEAQKTGEWLDGIGKLMEAELGPHVSELLEPYLSAIRELNPEGGIRFYPGSPKLARMLFRPQDRLSAMELHPEDYVRLHRLFEGDHHARITELDGWLALGAHLPPKEKRGIVLVDPPFEEEDEYQRLAEGLEKGLSALSRRHLLPVVSAEEGRADQGIPRDAAGARHPENALRRTCGSQRPRHYRTDGLRPRHRQPALYSEGRVAPIAARIEGPSGAGPFRLAPRLLAARREQGGQGRLTS